MARKTKTETAAPAVVKRRRREVALGALVAPQVEAVSGDVGLVGRLAAQWGAICPMLAAWTWPVGLRRGVLQVAVANDSVRQEMGYLAPTVIEAVNMVLGYAAVQRLQYVLKVRGAAGPVRQARPKAPGAAAQAEAGQVCARVEDEELRAALARLGAWVGGRN